MKYQKGKDIIEDVNSNNNSVYLRSGYKVVEDKAKKPKDKKENAEDENNKAILVAMEWNELQSLAAEKDIKCVGIKKEDLIELILQAE